MTRDETVAKILNVFSRQFEIENPDLDDNLREAHEFDSIDAIELLREIEVMLGTELTREEKKQAMDIRTINQIVDYVMELGSVRSFGHLSTANN
jgi:acyl carrier protein